VIVVSGASRGLGKAIADQLVNSGHHVLGLVRNPDDTNLDSLECDVSDYLSVRTAAKKIKRIDEQVVAIINVAGVASMNMAVTTDSSTVQKLIQTNLVGTINCCQLLAPLMMREKQGAIINFSTIAVALALKGEAIYAASKAGVESFTRAFAREVSDFNIQVNCIAPGPIKTDLLRGISDEQIESIVEQQVITKQFEKRDVCDLVELLLDERARSLSGQVFSVGGV